MAFILHELLLQFSFLAAFVTGVAIVVTSVLQ